MDQQKLRAWWWHKQGLDGSMQGKGPADVLAKTGWARSVGGVGPYLTLFARAGTSRDGADAAVAALDIHELPSARGCTHVLPKADYALGLAVAQAMGEDPELKMARKMGATDAEIGRLEKAVLKALEKGPLDPDALKTALGDKVRNFGEEGRKKGLTTTLPIALGRLQVAGEIRRIPVNGRIDQQKYRYALWRPNPLKSFSMSAEEARTELARRYFQWTGPASMAHVQWFLGLGVKAAKAVVEPLHLETVEGDLLMLPEDRTAFASYKPPKEPQYALVSSVDGLSLLRRDLKSIVDEQDAESAGIPFNSLVDLPSHAIFDRGRLVGLWEFDPSTQSIAWRSFVKKNRAMEQAVKATEEFVRDQLGDAKSFSLDSPKSRAPRIEALRKAAG